MYSNITHITLLFAIMILNFVSFAQQNPNVRLTYNQYSQYNTTTALNPNNPMIILGAWADNRAGNGHERVGFAFSNNEGGSWSPETLMTKPDTVSYIGEHLDIGEPIVAFNRFGTAFCCYRIVCDISDAASPWYVYVSAMKNFGPNPDWADILVYTVTRTFTHYDLNLQHPFS